MKSSVWKMFCKLLLIAYLIIACFPRIIYASSEELDFNECLSISNSKLHFSEVKNYAYISCIGQIKNSSNISWQEPVIEVQFFNEQNELIDTFTEYIYGMVVSGNNSVAFKVKDNADKPINEYQTHKVRITSAQPIIKYSPKKKKSNTLYRILISWAPMLLLIGVWIFFMRKYQGKNSPQKKIIDIQEKQFELLKKQNELFERLIETIKNK